MILGSKKRIGEEQRKSSEIRTIEDWLENATGGLVGPARDRICAEIYSHFLEAVNDRFKEGASEAQAETAALAELGDPKAAADQFRNRHLTVSEATRIGRSLSNFHDISPLLISYVTPCLMLGWFLFGISFAQGMAFATLLIGALFQTIGFTLVRLREVGANIRHLMAIEILNQFVFPIFWVFFYFAIGLNAAVCFGIGICVLICGAFFAFPYLRLWLKLSNVTTRQEVPPRGASVA